jgi:ribosomal-protein-alanine N-acetyltransferase
MSRKVPAGNKPMLETERLVLRPLSADEEDSLHRISNEPNVRLHLWDNEPVSEATIKVLVAQSDRMLSEEKIGVFGVRMRGREDLLGFCGFVRLEGMQEAELWYELTQKVWGRGIATEAAWACVRGGGHGACDRRCRHAQHRLAAGDREAGHELLGQHQR